MTSHKPLSGLPTTQPATRLARKLRGLRSRGEPRFGFGLHWERRMRLSPPISRIFKLALSLAGLTVAILAREPSLRAQTPNGESAVPLIKD